MSESTFSVIHHGLYGRIIEQHSELNESDARSLANTIRDHNFDGNGNSWVQVKPEPTAHERICNNADRFLGPEIVPALLNR